MFLEKSKSLYLFPNYAIYKTVSTIVQGIKNDQQKHTCIDASTYEFDAVAKKGFEGDSWKTDAVV
jgi:hypothetical protein